MSVMGLVVESFDPEHAGEGDLHAYYEVMVARQETDRPDEPRLTYEDVLGRLKNPFVGFGPVAYWVARLHGELVGLAIVYFMEEESSHIGLTEVIVHPRVRRRGIGATMLRAILPDLRACGRTFVETWQITEGSDGERFANALGFHTAHTVLSQALVIPETDSALWQQPVPPGTGYGSGQTPHPTISSRHSRTPSRPCKTPRPETWALASRSGMWGGSGHTRPSCGRTMSSCGWSSPCTRPPATSPG